MIKKSTILSFEQFTRYVFGPLAVVCCFYMSYQSYNLIVRMENPQSYEGRISETGVHVHPGMFGNTSEVFYLKILGRPDSIALFNLLAHHDRFTSELHKGDLVKVYFERRASTGILKTVMTGVEKGGNVLYELPKHKTLNYITTVMLLAMGLFGLYGSIFILGKPNGVRKVAVANELNYTGNSQE